jgi:hypothetical protein
MAVGYVNDRRLKTNIFFKIRIKSNIFYKKIFYNSFKNINEPDGANIIRSGYFSGNQFQTGGLPDTSGR